jgi:hypothetical protein
MGTERDKRDKRNSQCGDKRQRSGVNQICALGNR